MSDCQTITTELLQCTLSGLRTHSLTENRSAEFKVGLFHVIIGQHVNWAQRIAQNIARTCAAKTAAGGMPKKELFKTTF